MKKIVFIVAAVALLGAASCKKDDGDKAAVMPVNGWRVNGNTYNAKEATSVNAVFLCADSFGNTASVKFWGTPEKDKVYKIVGINLIDLKEDEAFVSFGTASPKYYSSTDYTQASLTVKMTGGKANVTIPEIWLKAEAGDSVRFSATMVQTR